MVVSEGGGLFFAAVCELLTVVASLAVEAWATGLGGMPVVMAQGLAFLACGLSQTRQPQTLYIF